MYLSIGILTFILNLFLSLHVIKGCSSTRRKSIEGGEDMVTFSLKAEKGKEHDTTEAVLFDDTVALK
jgi:hypothetical protein